MFWENTNIYMLYKILILYFFIEYSVAFMERSWNYECVIALWHCVFIKNNIYNPSHIRLKMNITNFRFSIISFAVDKSVSAKAGIMTAGRSATFDEHLLTKLSADDCVRLHFHELLTDFLYCYGPRCFVAVCYFLPDDRCGVSNHTAPGDVCRSFITHWGWDEMADDIFNSIFLEVNVLISREISRKFVSKGQGDNNSALAQLMAWRRTGVIWINGGLLYWRI